MSSAYGGIESDDSDYAVALAALHRSITIAERHGEYMMVPFTLTWIVIVSARLGLDEIGARAAGHLVALGYGPLTQDSETYPEAVSALRARLGEAEVSELSEAGKRATTPELRDQLLTRRSLSVQSGA